MFPRNAENLLSVPGRVNLIGEHIDYYGLPVMPMAIDKRINVSFVPRGDRVIHAVSTGFEPRTFPLDDCEPGPPGDWVNYLKAAVSMLAPRWPLQRGVDAAIHSDLPAAAGLSSSSALLTAFALALLHANQVEPSVTELLDLLPAGEQYVGTRGGGMDHAAVLASRAGCALLLRFEPMVFEHLPIPPDWTFLVAHSLTTAQKSGPAKAEYNARRAAGLRALAVLGLHSYSEALDQPVPEKLTSGLPCAERAAFRHAVTEAQRVAAAAAALRAGDARTFGALLNESHASLRDRLRVSNAALDELAACAVSAGALGARLTGAGFGGCALVLCRRDWCDRVRRALVEQFYARRPSFRPERHLFVATPSAGALHA